MVIIRLPIFLPLDRNLFQIFVIQKTGLGFLAQETRRIVVRSDIFVSAERSNRELRSRRSPRWMYSDQRGGRLRGIRVISRGRALGRRACKCGIKCGMRCLFPRHVSGFSTWLGLAWEGLRRGWIWDMPFPVRISRVRERNFVKLAMIRDRVFRPKGIRIFMALRSI